MRLIDAEALFRNLNLSARGRYDAIVNELIMNAPTVDAVPIRHGKWTRVGHIEHMLIVYKCSACNGDTIVDGDFCPNCGARMDEDE